MANVAPGIVLEDDSRFIAKGLTSKTDRLLSKTSQGGLEHRLSRASAIWIMTCGAIALMLVSERQRR
jgi:hypothetical protein